MIQSIRARKGIGLWTTLGLSFVGPSAVAEQSWLPVISGVEVAPIELRRSELERGWYPVVINPAKRTEWSSGPAPVRPAIAQTVTATAAQQPATTAEITRPKPEIEAPPKQAPKPENAPRKESLAESYCANIADAATDARFDWQKQALGEMEKELERRIAILEKRTAEYRDWLARRDAFVEKAQESLVRIYARMRPDAAASQLAAMDEETAAAVLTKLNPRNASAILNEMPPARAARLTMTIAGAAKVPPEQLPAPAAGGGRS